MNLVTGGTQGLPRPAAQSATLRSQPVQAITFAESSAGLAHAILQFGQAGLLFQHAKHTIKPHFWQVRLPESVMV